ncbi:DUF2971 domain-containing protein [Edwardsiella tarda]|uniref:DUF2971 domain-containing protein n=1 Tax=Edwardsiella tarda TaxID=636 RepID=UPI00351CB368
MEYLYKYREMSKNHLDALGRRKIWFSVGDCFNDPFDCTLNVPIHLMTGSSVLKFVESEAEMKKFKNIDKSIIALNIINNARQLVESGNINAHPLIGVMNIVSSSLLRSFVCCFSKNATNQLLWSHYSQRHTGYCIRYKRDTLLESLNLHSHGDVIYNDDPIDLLTEVTDKMNLANKVIYRKASCWSYEDEVRLIHADISENPSDKYRVCEYPNDAIDCIILGYNFDMSRLDELKEKTSNDNIIFKKIERSKNSYSLYVSPERL